MAQALSRRIVAAALVLSVGAGPALCQARPSRPAQAAGGAGQMILGAGGMVLAGAAIGGGLFIAATGAVTFWPALGLLLGGTALAYGGWELGKFSILHGIVGGARRLAGAFCEGESSAMAPLSQAVGQAAASTR